MFRSVVKGLGKFLLTVASSEEVRTSTARRPSADAASKRRFDEKVRRARRQRPAQSSILAGTVQLIGLDEIRAAVGSKWPAIADQAHSIADRTIKQNLQDDDTYELHHNDTYVVCFGGADRSGAERRTKRIVEDIKAALLREVPEANGLQVDHVVAELEWSSVESDDVPVLEAIAVKLKKVRDDAEQAARAWRRDLLSHASVLFSPVWSPERRAVSCYRGLLAEETGERVLRRLSSVSGPEELQAALADLDSLLFGRCVEAIHDIVQNGQEAQLIVPVNYHTMNDKVHRDNYARLSRDVPEAYRKFIIFELHGAPIGVPLLRLIELALILKAQGSGVLVEFGSGLARIQDLTGSGILGISLSAQLLGQRRPEVVARSSRLGPLAKAHGLKIFVHGADTLGMLESAVRAGVDFVDGRGVASAVAKPKGTYNWTPRTRLAA